MDEREKKSSRKRASRQVKKMGGRSEAAQSDRYKLYLASVQEPSFETSFFVKAFRRALGKEKTPLVLREDFCGTAAVCYQWVSEKKDRTAIGVDLDPEPLHWGAMNLAPEHEAGVCERVTLVHGDARDVLPAKADVLAAQNFSFWLFTTRDTLRAYLSAARQNLKAEGIMILDMMGGPESMAENHQDLRWVKGPNGRFRYIWEQERMNPIDHSCRYHISFEFKDGSRLPRAFTYDWRFWNIPEVRELVLEAGFDEALVFWEDTDAKGESTGRYRVRESAPNDPSWVAYIVAVKRGVR